MVTQIDQNAATGGIEPGSQLSSFLHDGENNIEEIFEKIALLNEENQIKAIETICTFNFSLKWLIESNEFPTNKNEFDNFILNLPITTYIGMGLTETNPRLPAFHSKCLDCDRKFSNIDDFRRHIVIHNKEITDDEYYEHTDCLNILRVASGLTIEQNSFMHNDVPLFAYACTHPDCCKCFQTAEEYAIHRQEEHDDSLNKLSFIIADVIRWMRKANKQFIQIPLIKDFFKNIFTGNVKIHDNNGNTQEFSFYDQLKYLDAINEIHEEELNGEWIGNINHKRIWVRNDSFIDNAITDQFGENEMIRIRPERGVSNFDMNHPLDCQALIHHETSIETSENEDDVELDAVTNDNFESFKSHIINELKKIKEPEELFNIIHLLTNVKFDDNIKMRIDSNDDSLPALFFIAFKYKWLPAPGISSPFINNNQTFKTLNALQNHIRKEIGEWSNNEAIGHETVYYFPITGQGRWRVKYDDSNNIMWNENLRTCQYFDCKYASLSSKFSGHVISGKHKHDCANYDKFGPFWGPHIKLAIDNNATITCGYFKYERTIYKCAYPDCQACFGRADDLFSHYASRAHHDKSKRVCFNCKRVWISKEEEIRHHNIEMTNRNRESARPIQEQVQNNSNEQQERVNIIQNQQHNEEATQNEQTTSQTEHQAEETIANTPDPIQTNQDESQSTIVSDDEHLIFNEQSNNHLIAQAREWISHYSVIEDNSIGIPTLTPARRKLVKKNINALYDLTIIPLLKKYMPLNESEDERIKLDGVIYKISNEFREHCRRALNLTTENMYRNPTSSQRVNDMNRRRISEKVKEETEALKASATSRDSTDCLKALVEIREIMKRDTVDLVGTNRINKLKKEIRTIINLRDDEWCNNVFGGRNDSCVDTTINLQDDQFERRCSWLRARIDETSMQANSMKEKIREMFGDNPRKCLDRYIWPKTTPECTITPEQFANHYGRDWSSTTEQYENPIMREEWNIDVTIREGVEQRFKDYMENTKKIEDIIRSRNYISAHGRDGISNALFRLAVPKSKEMFALIFKAIFISKHVPSSWKSTKTIMLYKKSDPSIPKNWRPIGITSTMYRIFAAHLSGFILNENKFTSVFHHTQKGFIGGGNGAMDHISSLNELMYHAKRINENCVLTAVDLTNAFGSVPHQLIFDTIERKGFNGTFLSIVKDIYRDNFTQIDVGGKRSEKIQIRKGVLQGCPLSPLLFNSCIDPLLTHLERFNKNDGIKIPIAENEDYSFTAQGYADDVVLIANDFNGAQNEINSLVQYCQMTGLVIAPTKCITIARNQGNQPNTPELRIGEHQLQIVNSDQSIKYLGAPISGNKSTRTGNAKAMIEEARAKTKLVFKSQLSLNQKLVAIRTYVLPCLDYIMTNSQCNITDLASLDSLIRGLIQKEIGNTPIPNEYAHIAMKDGGLGIPRMEDKGEILKVGKFSRMISSKSKQIKALALLSISEEEGKRGIETTENSPFLNWSVTEQGHLVQGTPNRGTSCAVIDAFHACKRMNICLHLENNTLKLSYDKSDGTTAECLVRDPRSCNVFIKNFFQHELISKIKGKRLTGHSFTGNITPESNPYRSFEYFDDKLFKFIIRGRTNTLVTPQNLVIWGKSENGRCPLCGAEKCTLNHTLNNCHSRSNQFTWRHNLLAEVLRTEIDKHFEPDMYKESSSVDIREIMNSNNVLGELSEFNTGFKPDIQFAKWDEERAVVIEITVPYNQETQKNGELMNTLELRQDEKENKYRDLINELRECTGFQTEYYTVVVSSLGHVTERTKQNMIKLFGKTKGKKICEKLSLSALRGSACIYYGKPPSTFGFTSADPWPSNSNESANENNQDNMNVSDNVVTNTTHNSNFTNEVSSNDNSQIHNDQEHSEQNGTHQNEINSSATQNQESPERNENTQEIGAPTLITSITTNTSNVTDEVSSNIHQDNSSITDSNVNAAAPNEQTSNHQNSERNDHSTSIITSTEEERNQINQNQMNSNEQTSNSNNVNVTEESNISKNNSI